MVTVVASKPKSSPFAPPSIPVTGGYERGGVSYAFGTGPTPFVTGGFGGGGSSSGGGTSYIDPNIAIQEQQRQRALIDLENARKAAEEKARQQAELQRQAQLQQQLRQQVIIEQSQLKAQQIQTLTNLNPPQQNIPVYTQPYLTSKQTGTINTGAVGGYKNVPVTTLTYVDPTGYGVQQERIATAEEQVYYKEQTNVLQASEGKPSAILKLTGGYAGTIGDIYRGAETRTREVFTEPTIGAGLKAINYVPGKTDLGVTTRYLESKGVPSFIAKGGEFLASAGLNILEDIREKPLKNVALYGVGYGIGFFGGGVLTGISKIPKIGGGLSVATKVGLYGTSAVLTAGYAEQTATKIYLAKTPTEKGAIFGTSLKDITLIGAGASRGALGFEQARGSWRTRGRTEYANIPQGEYPQAPTKIQLSLFKKNIYVELGNKPIAFHTTSKSFWSEGIITPSAGTSELPGLYASTDISTPFARISGSSSGKFNIEKFTSEFLTPPGQPGVAGLKPEGFRYSPFERVSPYKIGEQTFTYSFKNPPKQGWADVPGMKTEKEAIFRIGGGSYGIESKGYYVVIKKVKVPLDIFKYDKGLTEGVTNNVGGIKLYGGSSSYNIPATTYGIPLSPSLVTVSYSPPISISKKVSILGKTPSATISSISPSYLGKSYKPSSPSIKPSSSISSSLSLSAIASTKSSKRTPYSYVPTGGGSSTGGSSSSYLTPTKNKGLYLPRFKSPSLSTGSYGVSVRRRGKFTPIAKGLSLGKAFEVGQGKVSRTLAASFKISGLTGGLKVPKGFYASRKEPGVIIEKIGRRLKKGTYEIPEILSAKRMKGGKKRK